MAKLLRVLVIILLVLSAGALTLGIMLFNKREVLKVRTQKLENALIALGYTIEALPPESPGDMFPAKDVSPVTSEVLDAPQLSEFWDTYKQRLEVQDQPKMNLEERKQELMSYYKRNALGEYEVNVATGLKVTEGEGTMSAVIEDVLTKAEEQLSLLNETRLELKKTREELVTTITELNQRKAENRRDKKRIVELEAEVARLKQKIRELEAEIASLKSQIEGLKEQITEKDREIEKLEEKNKEWELKYEDLEKKYVALKEGEGDNKKSQGFVFDKDNLKRGQKGSIAAVDPEYNFVAIKVSDEFIAELFKDREEGDTAVPQIELLVKRPGEKNEFVTKVRLVQLRREQKIAVADILDNWQQLPVKEGDIVFY